MRYLTFESPSDLTILVQLITGSLIEIYYSVFSIGIRSGNESRVKLSNVLADLAPGDIVIYRLLRTLSFVSRSAKLKIYRKNLLLNAAADILLIKNKSFGPYFIILAA